MDHWDLVRAELAKQRQQRKRPLTPVGQAVVILGVLLGIAFVVLLLNGSPGVGSSSTTVDTHGYDGRVDNGVFTPNR